jgi:hypothetical protein
VRVSPAGPRHRQPPGSGAVCGASCGSTTAAFSHSVDRNGEHGSKAFVSKSVSDTPAGALNGTSVSTGVLGDAPGFALFVHPGSAVNVASVSTAAAAAPRLT